MAHAMLSFNEQIERIGEVAAVIAVGMLLWAVDWQLRRGASSPLLLLVIRPVSVLVGLARSKTSPSQRALIGWFGIRGIGSLYYLAYAMNHGLAPDAGGDDGRAGALGRRRLDRRPRHLGDAADELLRAAQAGDARAKRRPDGAGRDRRRRRRGRRARPKPGSRRAAGSRSRSSARSGRRWPRATAGCCMRPPARARPTRSGSARSRAPPRSARRRIAGAPPRRRSACSG